MTSKEGRITLYRTTHCPRCVKAARNLKAILAEKGLHYEEVVIEKFIDRDEAAIEELRGYGYESAPTIRIGTRVLVEDEPTYSEAIRQLLFEAGI